MTRPPSEPPPTVSVTVEAATRDFDALLAAVTSKGTHVTITRDEIPVAVIVPWAWYRRGQERLARYDVAYWASWSDAGDFDDDAYASMVADLNEPTPLTPTSQHTTDPVQDHPGEANPQEEAGRDDDG